MSSSSPTGSVERVPTLQTNHLWFKSRCVNKRWKKKKEWWNGLEFNINADDDCAPSSEQSCSEEFALTGTNKKSEAFL